MKNEHVLLCLSAIIALLCSQAAAAGNDTIYDQPAIRGTPEETTCQLVNDKSGGPQDYTRVCVTDREKFFRANFGNSPFLLVDYFADRSCQDFWMSRVFVADGTCNVEGDIGGVRGAYRTFVSDPQTMTFVVYMSFDSCNERGPVSLFPAPTLVLNTATCVNDKNGYVKYYLVDPSSQVSTSSSSVDTDTNSTDTNNSADGTDASTTENTTTTASASSGVLWLPVSMGWLYALFGVVLF
ncbi:hypothetical protein PI124_g6882 [Phytophthora idaei]|nr:hypothetical protein PI125_g9590 [Phytophthora idaei]KAG3248442.1 hypothetical protein PI124_g6882 [Phytophthora idaei]